MLLLAAAAVLATPSSSPAQSESASAALAALRPQAQRRVAANPDMGPRVQLRGHLPGWVRAENTAAATVPVSAPLKVTVVLKRDAATQAAFETLLEAQQTPGSALFAKVCESCRAIEATEDIHASASYRQHLAAVLSRRALERACGLPSHGMTH